MKIGRNVRVCVIGAGPCGITAAKHLLQAGVREVVVYEKGDRVGGNWAYSPQPGHSGMYEVAHAITSKAVSQYPDFPLPDDCPDYPSHRVLGQYFHDYAEHFGVLEHIEFGTCVEQAEELEDHTWRITLDSGRVEHFDHLLVANGHHWDPRMPSYPGEFTGEFIHSHRYRHNRKYTGKRVLVIGGGNSSVDIVTDIGRCAELTALSWRRGYYVVPKFVFGRPSDVLGRLLIHLPLAIRKRLTKLLWRLVVGGNRRYGLPEPDHGFGERTPIISTELLDRLRHGDVQPRPDVKRFDGRTVTFVDGTAEEFDAVIAATGYHVSFPFLDRKLIDFSEGDIRLFLGVFHPDHPTLHFIGLLQPQGCIWPIADAQAQLVANYVIGNYRLPADIERRIDKQIRRTRKKFPAAPHTLEVENHDYLKLVRREIPKDAPTWPSSPIRRFRPGREPMRGSETMSPAVGR